MRIILRNLKASADVGFIEASLTGDIITIFGLLKKISSNREIDVDESGRIDGLF